MFPWLPPRRIKGLKGRRERRIGRTTGAARNCSSKSRRTFRKVGASDRPKPPSRPSVAQTFRKIWNWIAAAYGCVRRGNRFLLESHRRAESISVSALITCLANELGLLNQVNRGKCCGCGKVCTFGRQTLRGSGCNFAERRLALPRTRWN